MFIRMRPYQITNDAVSFLYQLVRWDDGYLFLGEVTYNHEALWGQKRAKKAFFRLLFS